MKRRLLALGAVAALILGLVGCGSSIDRGVVTAKVVEPQTTTFIQQCAGYNSQGVCISWVAIPIIDDEDYRLDLVDGEATGYVYVTREAFDEYDVGDWFEGAP